MNGAEFIVRALIKSGQTTVFGYPGGTVLSIYDSLYRHRREIRHIRTANEQGAAHAADGFARMTKGAGVCIATSGPGATNLVTGIANAYMDSVPVVFITGNVEHTLIGTDSFQEVDIVGMTLGVTKHSWAVRSASMLCEAMTRAFSVAQSGRKGPVLIDVAKDVLEAGDEAFDRALDRIETYCPPEAASFGDDEIDAAINILKESERPVIIAGGGAVSSGAGNEILVLAERLGAPVCNTLMGTGLLPSGHRLNFGLTGQMASDDLKRALAECDLVMAVGARMSNRTADLRLAAGKRLGNWTADLQLAAGKRPGNWTADLQLMAGAGARLLQIDADRAEINKILRADAYIAGDAKTALRGILARFRGIPVREPWFSGTNAGKCAVEDADFSSGECGKSVAGVRSDECGGGDANGSYGEGCSEYANSRLAEVNVPHPKRGYVDPLSIFEAVREAAGEAITVATDVGCHQLFTARYFRFEPVDRFITSGGLGTMGFGLGAAEGAQIAAPERVTVLFTGDGSFMMDMNELATVRNERLPLIIIVMRNGELGMVHEMQKKRYGRRYSQTVLGSRPGIPALCRAFGLRGVKVSSASEILAEVRRAIALREAVVIDVRTVLSGT